MGFVKLSVLALLKEHWKKGKMKVIKRKILTVFRFLATHQIENTYHVTPFD